MGGHITKKELLVPFSKDCLLNMTNIRKEIETHILPYGLTAEVFRSGRVVSLYFMLWFY